MALNLTKNGILSLLEGENTLNQNVLVQVLNLKPAKQGNYLPCNISDGFRKIKAAILNTNEKFTPETHNLALIRIKKHSIIKNGQVLRGVEIQQFDIQGVYPQQVGDPVNYSSNIQLSQHGSNIIDIDKLYPKKSKKPIEIIKPTNTQSQKRPVVLELDDNESKQDITMRTLKNSDKISDLYVDLPAWEIVCRITDMAYKEFISKKTQKFTQILNIQMMDRTGMKIDGTAFGDYGKQLQSLLQLNALYRISKGQIREQSYQTNKGPKFSKYTITFGKNSLFTRLHDNSLIPAQNETSYMSVKAVVEQKDFDKQYDVVGIVTEVGQEKELTDKNGNQLTKRMISLSDPESNQTIQVTLWRDIKFEQNLKGHTVLLKNFKLNSYMSNVSLNSLFKSQIKALQSHPYRQYQEKLNLNQFKQVSQVQSSDHSDDCRTIKKLQNEIQYMEPTQTIYSSLNAFVSLMSFKGKWYYDSCPKCRKTAEAHMTCVHCHTSIDQPTPRFILPIQIADFTGSIWTTAFDQFANVLLHGKEIKELKKFDQVKLRQEGQRRVFQQFRFKLSTKRQSNGSIKHTLVGKPQQITPEKVALQNIQRIYQYQ